jgi:hypothetical protein
VCVFGRANKAVRDQNDYQFQQNGVRSEIEKLGTHNWEIVSSTGWLTPFTVILNVLRRNA